MKIFVDIDSTITDFGKVLLDTLNAHYNKSYEYKDITHWDWFTGTFGKKAFFPLSYDGFWDNVVIDPRAVLVLESFVGQGHQVYLCSASAFTSSLGHKIKTTLAPFNCNLINESNIIICEHKWLLADRNSVIIDDKLDNVKEFIYEGGGGIVFDQPWNQENGCMKLRHRVNNWDEIANIILV